MKVFVNGDAREVDDSLTVADLLAALALEPRHVAVEINLQVVPRGVHQRHRLAEGDRLEIVTLVGGG